MNKIDFSIAHWIKHFNKGLDKHDEKEGVFKRLKSIENAQKGLINGDNKPDVQIIRVNQVYQVYQVFLILYQVKVKMKVKMKIKKLHVNFIIKIDDFRV